MDLVSVIIPVYKTESYLPSCVESILAQTYENLEIILVDDGSPDSCPDMCDTYAKHDNRIRVIHRNNGGLSAARNSGIEAATGKWLTFCDSDDRIAPRTVQTMIDLSEGVDIVKIRLVRKKPGEPLESTYGRWEFLTGEQALHRIYHGEPQVISACGKLFRRELFDDIRFPEGLYYEDEFTTPKLYYRANRVVFSESVLYFYMQWESDSIMRSALTENKLRHSAYVTRERLAFFRESGLKELEKKAIIDHWLKLKKLVALENVQPVLCDICRELCREMEAFEKENRWILLPVQLRQRAYRVVQKYRRFSSDCQK